MVAITGPLNTVTAIQDGGAPLSRGGIRVVDSAMARLRDIPAGTPIDVMATLVPAKPVRHHRSVPVG